MTLGAERGRLGKQFFWGLAWTALWAGLATGATGRSFLITLPATFVLLLASTALAAYWLYSRTLAHGSRKWQFGIATMLVAMLYVAIALGVTRWIVIETLQNHEPRAESPTETQLLFGGVVVTFVFVASAGPMLCVLDCLVWTAVWLMRKFSRRRTPIEGEP